MAKVLIENTRLTKRNLDAAIATATQPGYFRYHLGTDEALEAEKKNKVRLLRAQLKNAQSEIDKQQTEINRLLGEGRKASAPRKSQADTFAAWHREFGVASESTLQSRDMMSDFKNNSRIYGKTKHHQAFKSVAVTMKRGNLTK